MPQPPAEIEVVVNGERRRIRDGLTVAELLAELGLAADRVAVELNREILKREQWTSQPLKAGDQLEIVHFVGGG